MFKTGWSLTLNFCVWVGHDYSLQGIEDQGHMSESVSWVGLMRLVQPRSTAFFSFGSKWNIQCIGIICHTVFLLNILHKFLASCMLFLAHLNEECCFAAYKLMLIWVWNWVLHSPIWLMFNCYVCINIFSLDYARSYRIIQFRNHTITSTLSAKHDTTCGVTMIKVIRLLKPILECNFTSQNCQSAFTVLKGSSSSM